jgi:hypothetical protein
MNTNTGTIDTATTTEATYTIEGNDESGFYITINGLPLANRYGSTRYFSSRNSARKRIARERSGDFHR